MEDNKTLKETIKDLREKNEGEISFEEKKRTNIFQQNISAVLDKIASRPEDIQTSEIGVNIEKNLINLLEPMQNVERLTKDEKNVLRESFDDLIDSIKKSNDVNGEEQERLIQIISESKTAINSSSVLDREVLKKFGEKIVDSSIDTASGLAGLASGNNPLVMMLTRSLLQGTKQSALQVKEWAKRRKEQKIESKKRKTEFLKSLESEKETRKTIKDSENVGATKTTNDVESVSLNKEKRENFLSTLDENYTDSERYNKVDNDVDEMFDESDIMEMFGEAKDSFETFVEDISKTVELESQKLSNVKEATKTTSDVETNLSDISESQKTEGPQLIKETPEPGLTNFTQNVSDEKTHDLISQLIDLYEDEKETRLIKDAEDLETNKEEKDFQTKLLNALESDESGDLSIKESNNPLLAIGAFLFGVASGFVKEIGFIFGKIRSIFMGWIRKIKNSKLGRVVSEFIDNIKKGNIGKFFTKLKTFLTENKFIKSISSKIDDIKKGFKPITNFFTKIKNFFVKTFTKLSKMFTFADDAGGIVGKFLNFGKKFGRFLGKLAWPITVIVGVFDTVTGFIDGYKEDDIIGGIKGAITGLFDSLIGAPLNMIKDAISWLVNFFGFVDVSKKIDEFDFTESFRGFVDGIFGFFGKIKDFFVSIKNFLSNQLQNVQAFIEESGFASFVADMINKIIGAPFDLLKNSVVWIMEKMGLDNVSEKLKEFSFSDLISDMFDKLFETVEKIVDYVSELFSFDAIKDMMPDWLTNMFKGNEDVASGTNLGQPKSNMQILEDSKAWYRYDGKIEKIQDEIQNIEELKEKIQSAKTLKEKQSLIDQYESSKQNVQTLMDQAVEAQYVDPQNAELILGNLENDSKQFSMLKEQIQQQEKLNFSMNDKSTDTLSTSVAMDMKYQDTVHQKEEIVEKSAAKAVSIAVSPMTNMVNKSTVNNTGIISGAPSSMPNFIGE